MAFKGNLLIGFRNGKTVQVKEGEILIIPKGVEHRPHSNGEIVFNLLFEPKSILPTGNNHTDNQQVNLQLKDPNLPINYTLEKFDEPAQRYCPAGVYEVQNENGINKFVINSQNCIHCKTCDIKEPSQNITWVTPEGSGGPKYGNM